MDPDIIEMIESSLDSVWSLELVLLLFSAPERCWETSELVAELRSSHLVVSQSVATLVAAGLAVENTDGTVRFAPASPALHSFVEDLEREYRARPASIRRLILGRSNAKLQTFSNAFLLRRPSK